MQAVTLEMPTQAPRPVVNRYARCIEASKRVHWDIDRDVFRGRRPDVDRKFMPDALSRVAELDFLKPAERRFLSQVQGRTYANLFGLIERFIGAKSLELSRDHWLGDQDALEALVRFTDEELKHQEMFRRLELMTASGMPAGYAFLADANELAQAVLARSNWAVLALTLDVEISTQAHYRTSLEPDAQLSDLWTDLFHFHWKEEAQHAIVHELEWRRAHAKRNASERDQGVTDLIDLVGAVDGILAMQAHADAAYFLQHAGRAFLTVEEAAIRDLVLKAYRWQHIVIGVREPRFLEVLRALTTPAQMERIGAALRPILEHVEA
jgi:hypothetical protein